jgi:putative endonuclease
VYIIETEDGTYYTGQTNDLARRLKEHVHSNSHGAFYLRMHKPTFVVYLEQFETRSEAMQRELQIKNDRKLKMDLIGPRRDIREVIATEESYK